MKKKQQKKRVLQAIKIAVGSSAAIYVAEVLNLEYAISAGSIALLTLVTTKWETVKLSWFRLVTFLVSSVLAWIVFTQIQSEWLAYGIYIFLIVIVSEEFGWKATISVNAVIGMHFMAKRDFEASFVFNEFLLVLIGITVAVVLNLFYDYAGQRKDLVRNMRYTENRMQMILGAIAAYLADKEMQYDIWAAIRELESQIRIFIDDAYEYQDNTFQSHPEYYINYFVNIKYKHQSSIINHQLSIINLNVIYFIIFILLHICNIIHCKIAQFFFKILFIITIKI